MPNLPISLLPITTTADTTDVIAIVNNGVTKQISKNDFLNNIPNFSGNSDNLDGASMRTIYSRTNVITYGVGTEADLFSGSTNFGSRNFPSSFFTNSVNYYSKIIHFRATGLWGNEGGTSTDATITTKFGDNTIATITTTLDFSNNKPSEIFGEIVINNGNAICCYSVGWCDQTGDFRREPLSDPSSPVVVSGFTGGDFKLLIGSTTNRSFTSYIGYIQVWN